MTKKDYELIANQINIFASECDMGDEQLLIDEFASHLAFALKEENSRFDRAKFLLACGLTPKNGYTADFRRIAND